MADTTITGLTAVLAANLDDTAVLPVDDKNGNTRKATVAQLRTAIAAAAIAFLSTVSVAGATTLTGNVGVGGASDGSVALWLHATTGLSGVGQYGIQVDNTYTSAATTSATGILVNLKMASAAFTTTNGYGVYLNAPTLSNTAVTSIHGLYVANQGQAKSTNAYGVYIAAQGGAATRNIGLYNAGTTQLVGNAAIGTTINTAILLNISGSLTGTGYGAQIAVDATGTVSSAVVNAVGTTSGAGNRDHIAAFQSACVHNGTGTMTSMYGVYVGDTLTAGAGTVSYYYGARINAPLGTGVVTTAFGGYIAAMNRGATNNYGLYIEAPASGATTNIGLYNAGTSTLVGAVLCSSTLNVVTSIAVNGKLFTFGANDSAGAGYRTVTMQNA